MAACSVAQFPLPWSQLERLTAHPSAAVAQGGLKERQAVAFLRRETVRGEHVAVFFLNGHRDAYEIGIVDEVPYSNEQAMPALSQWQEAIRMLASRHVHRVFIGAAAQREVSLLQAAGYELLKRDPGSGVYELTG